MTDTNSNVVREWENQPDFGSDGEEIAYLGRVGDQMYEALTAQAKTIEGLERKVRHELGVAEDAIIRANMANAHLAVAEATVTELRAEIARLVKSVDVVDVALKEEIAARATAESRLETARGVLEEISESRDAGRHDGLPEPYPAHESYAMWAIAREALAALPSPPITIIKGEG